MEMFLNASMPNEFGKVIGLIENYLYSGLALSSLLILKLRLNGFTTAARPDAASHYSSATTENR